MKTSNNRTLAAVLGAIFLGVIIGLILASNFDWTDHIAASQTDNKKVVLGSDKAPLENKIDIDALDHAFVDVAKEVKPSVVTITSAKIYKMRRTNPFSDFFGDEFFRQFFQVPDRRGDQNRRQEDEEEEFRQQGLGSGVIVSSDGYIITNNHVIKDADEITVVTLDNKEYKAEVVGTDANTDVAVIKIDAKNIQAIRLGDSDKIEVGQWVLAIGNPFSQLLEHTVTHGIVSAKGRSSFQLAQYEDFIQTDAAINPGNSGGALVNLRGELIGINTAIISGSGGNVGIGFAIPINMARHVMEMLIDKGKVVRGWLGVYIQGIDNEMAQALGLKDTKGALVTQVQANSPAEKAGIKPEDVILEIDGKEIKDNAHLMLTIASIEPDKTVKVKIHRDGKEMNISVELGQRPDEEVASRKSSSTPTSTEKIGIRVENLTNQNSRQYGYNDNDEGVLVTYVKSGSIAYREGIREGDLIKQINKRKIINISEFNKIIDTIKSGEIVFIRLRKGNDHYYVSFKMPEEK